jgi:hypothetical protein
MTNCKDTIEINVCQKTANVSSHPRQLLNIIDNFFFIFSDGQHTGWHDSHYKNFPFVLTARNELSLLFILHPLVEINVSIFTAR